MLSATWTRYRAAWVVALLATVGVSLAVHRLASIDWQVSALPPRSSITSR